MPNCYLCRIVAAVQWIQIIGLKFNIWQSHLFISIIIFICSWSEREKKCSLKLVSIWNVHSGTRASMHCHTGREKWGYCASKVLIFHKSLFAFPSLDWICGNKDLMSASLLLNSTFFFVPFVYLWRCELFVTANCRHRHRHRYNTITLILVKS